MAESDVRAESNTTMRAVASILGRRLLDRLHEELGGTYGVGVSGDASSETYGYKRLTIGFSSKPERVAELQRATFAVIDTLLRDGITDEELARTQLMLVRQREVQLPYSWMSLLSQSVTEHRSLDEMAAEFAQPTLLTKDAIHVAMRRVLKQDRYVLVTELPVRLAPSTRDELLMSEW